MAHETRFVSAAERQRCMEAPRTCLGGDNMPPGTTPASLFSSSSCCQAGRGETDAEGDGREVLLAEGGRGICEARGGRKVAEGRKGRRAGRPCGAREALHALFKTQQTRVVAVAEEAAWGKDGSHVGMFMEG